MECNPGLHCLACGKQIGCSGLCSTECKDKFNKWREEDASKNEETN